MQNAHGLKQLLASVRTLASGPRGSEAEYALSHTSSSLFAYDWPLHSPITIEETMSPAQPSRYENSSAPPPNQIINALRDLSETVIGKNVGCLDRTARLALGHILIVVGVAVATGYLDIGFTGTLGLAVAALVLVAGAIFVVTGTTQRCTANQVARINTHNKQN
jgi:energy-converting hydrogenase Eha subunit C